MNKGRKPLLVALLAVALMAVGLGSTAAASGYVSSAEAEDGVIAGYLHFSIHAYGQSDLTAAGTMEWTYPGHFLYQADIQCLYVDPERHLAMAAGPVTVGWGQAWGVGDGMIFSMQDTPEGDAFMMGTIHDLEEWPGYPDLDWVSLFCGNEFYQEHLGEYLVPLTAGDIVISAIDTIDDVLGDFDEAVAAGDLASVGGQGNLNAFRNKLTNIARWLESGNMTAACGALREAQERSDGLIQPKDWVQGTAEAMEHLAAGIAGLIAQNGC
jgi:hypothetical protein